MYVLILAATHETVRNSLGDEVPLPLFDIVKGVPVLTELVHRASRLEGLREIIVVTNEFAIARLKTWHASLKENSKLVRLISDGTTTPNDRMGAIGDLIFGVREACIDDDLMVLGGDNWFNYSLAAFLEQARKHSPAVVLTRHQGSFQPARFGMAEVDSSGRIARFIEKPADAGLGLKASCMYFFARQELVWLSRFQSQHSTNCSPGTFLEWLTEQTSVYGIPMGATLYDLGESLSGPDLLMMSAILRSVGHPEFATWDRAVLRELDLKISSYEELLKTAHDPDANHRLIAARLMGYVWELLDGRGCGEIQTALIELLNDPAQNAIGVEDREEDDASDYYVSATAAESLVRLRYAPTVAAVFDRARTDGHPVSPRQNRP